MAKEETLVVLNGPSPGQVVPLRGVANCVLGRDASCQVPVDDPEASRQHATIWRNVLSEPWRIRDCGSRNGTFLNSRPVQESSLRPGDLIRIGQTLVVFCSAELAAQDQSISPLPDNTRVRRVLGAERQRLAETPLANHRTPGPMRKLYHLYRLSKDLHGADNVESLVRRVLTSLRDGIGAEASKVCLRGVDGRLRVLSDCDSGDRQTPQFLAHWIVERDEALLVALNDNPAGGELPATTALSPLKANEAAHAGSRAASSPETGAAIGAPIPGRPGPRGAVECFQPSPANGQPVRSFDMGDLEFVISVAQLTAVALENLEHREKIERTNDQLRSRLQQNSTQFLGNSPAVRKLLEQVTRVAPTDATVLTLGESGTGKELVARILHELSHRSEGPFIAVNCAAVSDSLLESELFGHERGAFTGAEAVHKGQFERAHRGTIFLDEVGEMSERCQAKLLRLLEGQPFERLGGSKLITVDVRIVAATHRNLRAMVQEGRFREDLWYRLRVIELSNPPLRERGDDAVLLASHFLQQFRRELGRGPRRFSSAAIETIRRYHWHGNVRELKNAVERAVVLGAGDEVAVPDLGLQLTLPVEAGASDLTTLAAAEQRHIDQVLEFVAGNKTEACKILGIGRATLYNKLGRQRRK